MAGAKRHLEGWVKDKIKEILKPYRKLGLWYYMPPASMYGRAGVPDFVCCFRGQFIGIETKANGGKLSELQLACHAKIRAAGGKVYVIDEPDLEAFKGIVESWTLTYASSEQCASDASFGPFTGP